MARRLELLEDELRVSYTGLSAAAVLAQEIVVPYSAISAVRIGLRDLPGALAIRVGVSTAPLGDTRRGTFWAGGRRVFLDLNDREHAVVLELEDQKYSRVALGVDDPEALAKQLRVRARPAG